MTWQFWPCPSCAMVLYVSRRPDGSVEIRRGGKAVTRCPGCKQKRLNTLYREQRRAAA